MRREINIYIHCVIILSMSTYRTIINKSNQSFIPPHNCWASYMMIYDIKYIDKVLTPQLKQFRLQLSSGLSWVDQMMGFKIDILTL